jgi:serine/threonine protein phosphatase PrpC
VADAIALIAAGPCLQASVEAISAAILQVNSQLSDALASGVHSRAMGTTVIAVAIADAECACLWAGDSRLYLYRNLGLYQMSCDHSIVQELLDQGVIEMDEISSHPQRHIITRAVGVDPALELEVISFRLQSGDVLLLCSDGLYTELNADAIMQVLAQDGDCTHKAQALIEGVLEGRARDNVTVTVIEIGQT